MTWSRRVLSAASAAATIFLGATQPLRAQSSRSVSAANGISMTPHRLPSDTGRMAWGHQDYSRYTNADPCDRAIADVAVEVWRTRTVDTSAYDVTTDTLPSAAVAVARTCGPRFTVDGPPAELWSVMRISLVLDNDAQAARAVERQLSLAKSPSEKAAVLNTAIFTYLDSHRPRLAAAQALLKQLDALGAAVRAEQYAGHVRLMGYWQLVYNPDSVRTHATTARSLALAMSPEERNEIGIPSPYMALLWLENDAQNLAATKALITDGLREVGDWRRGKGSQLFVDAQRLLDMQTALYGKKTRPLAGTYWYNTAGKPHPLAGVVSMIVHVDHSCGSQCFPLYAVLRQLKTKYGPDLDLTLVTDTRGFAPGTGPIPAAEEAKYVAKYYLDSLKIPTALLVDESPVSKAMDGHLEYKRSPIGEMFDGWEIINTVIIDRAGKVQWLGVLSFASDKRTVEAAIDRIMGATPKTP